MDYNTYDGLHNLVKDVLCDNYAVASANIIYLEELTSKNYVIYLTQFRDVLMHLTHIYETENIFDSTRKSDVLTQLERIKGHLERIVIDSYQKICVCLKEMIENSVHQSEWLGIKAQLAQRIKDLRISDTNISFSERKENFQQLIEYMESAINKFRPVFGN